MTSETILKLKRKQAEKKRVEELIKNIESLYPFKNRFLYPDNNYTNYAKALRNDP